MQFTSSPFLQEADGCLVHLRPGVLDPALQLLQGAQVLL